MKTADSPQTDINLIYSFTCSCPCAGFRNKIRKKLYVILILVICKQ